MKSEQDKVKRLVEEFVYGNEGAFEELKQIANPLLISLSAYYSSLHPKFEFDDFYSICLMALYEACMSFNGDNPCFLSYAKVVCYRQCLSELDYWNYEKRNIFKVEEIPIANVYTEFDSLSKSINVTYLDVKQIEKVDDIVLKKEWRENINQIIEELFDKDKAKIMTMYIFKDMQISEISVELGLKYKNTHSTVSRGVKRIKEEYRDRFLDKTPTL